MKKSLHPAQYALGALLLFGGVLYEAKATPMHEGSSLTAPEGISSSKRASEVPLTALDALHISHDLFNPGPAASVAIVVKGKVTDENGGGLPGVTVKIQGTSQGAVTDLDGNYSISVPDEGATLVFSFIGYVSQSIVVGNQRILNVSLVPDTETLSEVVVVGYGTQKKEDVTGAIATMKTEKLTERPLQRVDQALVGQMSGVRVQQTSGVPGAGFKIQVRGSGSISAGDQPLYVVDGFPLAQAGMDRNGGFSTGNPLDNINPSDIESIQVLKDASSAAIYGSRGANGVVIITTKSGKTGKPKISYNTNFGFSETAKKLDMLSGEEWIDRAIESINHAWVNSGEGRTANQTSAEREAILGRFNRGLILDERWLDPNHEGLMLVDWQDEMFRRGFSQNHQLTASGGTDAVKYYISGDFLDQEGIAIGVGYKRYSGRANVDVKANDKLKFGLNLSPSYSVVNDPGVEGKDQQMHIAVSSTPVVEASTGLDVNVGDNGPYLWGSSRVSPVRVIENSIGQREIFRTLISTYAQYDLLKNLSYKSTFNFDNSDASDESFSPSFVTRSRQATGGFRGYRRQTFVNENTLSYHTEISDAHKISALGGISYNFGRFTNWRIQSAEGFGTDDIPTLNGANNINKANTYTSQSRNTMLSYFGRVQYSFRDRYLFGATVRRDGSSRFGDDTKWGVFPSASLGWRVSEESFMQSIDFISDLKLRASWGLSGNDAIGNYAHIAMLGFSNYSFGGPSGKLSTGQVPVNFPNPNLGWEEAETFNYGLDVGLFKNRIFTSFDYYRRTNSNLLLEIPVPTATGFTRALTNIGEVFNEGWDLELTTHNLTGAFNWSTNVNLSWNRNEVTKLGPDNTPIYGGAWDIPHNVLMVGEPMYSINVVQQDGILTAADIANGAALYGNQEEGDPKYVDQITVDTDGDGIPDERDGLITPDDRVLSGHPNPDYVWGINNSISWKGFDLNVLLQGQWGGKIYSNFGRAVDRTGMGWVENSLGIHRDRWRSPEDPGAGERGKAYSSFGRIKNTDWLYPNDYWRVRNLTLGYNLKQIGMLDRSNFIQNARLYVTAENWFGGDKYIGGFNPEAVNNAGDDYGAFPLSKSIIFGLNLTF